jgi:hypothetical protein
MVGSIIKVGKRGLSEQAKGREERGGKKKKINTPPVQSS